ncbi:MAG TPA: hypothetical protein VM890_11000 [Longimicrobium sp.]|nr:hypothetical protein [Longimicrobium sp.]
MRSRTALLPLLALVMAAAPGAAQNGENAVPRELLQALLIPVAVRGAPEPAIFVGRLPEAIPASLVPPAATVVGGVGEWRVATALLTVPQAPAEAIAGWRAQLERAGWRASDASSLQPAPGVPALGLCGPGRETLGAWATARPEGGSTLQMRVIAADVPHSPCSGVRQPVTGDVPFPPLRPLKGVQMTGSGGSASPDYHDANGRMRTTRSPADLAVDLVAQLRQAGWATAAPRADAGGATAWATMRDAGGKSWRALVAVLPVAEGERAYVVRVVGASTEPRNDMEWVPVARDAGPPVPGELARALLVQPGSSGNGNGEVEEPTLVAGRLPPELAAAPLPAGARVIGGAAYPNHAVALATIPGSLAEYAAALERAGWRPVRQRGLLRGPAAATPSEFCDPNGRSVQVSAFSLPEGGSQLRLSSHAFPSCTPEWIAAFDEVPVPPLPRPEGAKVLGGGGGGGGMGHDWGSYGRLDTPLPPAAVVEHYAGLLRRAGWTFLPPASDPSTATATGELRDAQGRTWHALLAAVALSATERDVLVRVVRAQP